MWQYLVKRFPLLFITLIGICVLSFLVITAAPGDPAYTAIGIDPSGKGRKPGSLDQVIENTKRTLYLDRPAILNVSPNTRRKVAHEIVQKLSEGSDSQRKTAL